MPRNVAVGKYVMLSLKLKKRLKDHAERFENDFVKAK